MAVARPAASGWLVPQPPKPSVECVGCRNAEKTLALRLAEQETRLRIDLVDQFSVLMKEDEERHNRNMVSQEERLMKLVRHREEQMLETLAAHDHKKTQGGKRTRATSSDLSDSDDDGALDSAAAAEIIQLREEVTAAAKTVAAAEFRAAHAERQLQEVLAGAAGESAEAKVCELNSLLDEARMDHLRNQQEIQDLRDELERALEDVALKEMQLDEAAISVEELEKVAELKANHLSLLDKIKTFETSETQLLAKITTLETADAELREKILAYDASEDDLVEKMASLGTRELEAVTKLKDLEEKLALQTTELSQLRDSASRDNMELTTLRQQAASVDCKENDLELEVKRLLQSLRTLTEDHNAACAEISAMKAALAGIEERNRALATENEALTQTVEQQHREADERIARAAVQFAQLEDLLKREREATALAKRDSAAATAQLYRLTPARRQRSLSLSNADDTKENTAVGANVGPPEAKLQTRSSKRLTQRAGASVGDSRKTNRKLFVQKECDSLEPSPELKPMTRSRRK